MSSGAAVAAGAAATAVALLIAGSSRDSDEPADAQPTEGTSMIRRHGPIPVTPEEQKRMDEQMETEP